MAQASFTKSRRRNRRGAAVVELALTIVVLTNLAFGMVEFGYYFYVKNALQNGAREGARQVMASGGTNSSVTTAVTNALAGQSFPSNSYTTSITDTSGNAITVSTASPGTRIKVTVSATWSTIGAGFRPLNLIGGAKTVSGVVVMRAN